MAGDVLGGGVGAVTEYEEGMVRATERIAAALEKLAEAMTIPTCAHGTVGFCNSCFMVALSNARMAMTRPLLLRPPPGAMLILSVFPGIDLLGRAFEEEWPEACIVRGPDLLWGGDIKTFHPPAGRFDGVIGGPPCQMFSPLRLLVDHNHQAAAVNLIPEFERCVAEAAPAWFLMENVRETPLPEVPGYIVKDQLVKDVYVGGETKRLRRFSFGTPDGKPLHIQCAALHSMGPAPTVLASGGAAGARKWRKGASAMGYKTRSVWETNRRLQGLPDDFLEKAPFTVAGKIHVVGNGVPLAMGQAIARAVRRAVCA